MIFVDTHTHLYLEQFDDDRTVVVKNSIAAGTELMLLPNIDSNSLSSMKKLSCEFPENCLPMMGLHPTSVKEDYENQLALVEKELQENKYIAVGEIGIDLYWDNTFIEQQQDAFRRQLNLAKKYKLPVSIHTRESFDEIYAIVKHESTDDLRGVFHYFTGSIEQAKKVMDLGFHLGIGGVLTFKNSKLDETVKHVPLEFLVLETDAPFLAPAPFRGKRNESSYIKIIAEKLAAVTNTSIEKTAAITTDNAAKIYKLAIK